MTTKLKKNAKYRHINNPKYVIQVVDTKKKVALVRVLNTTEGHGTKGDLYLIPRLKVDHYQQVDVKKTAKKELPHGVTRWVILATNGDVMTLDRPPVANIGQQFMGRKIADIKKVRLSA